VHSAGFSICTLSDEVGYDSPISIAFSLCCMNFPPMKISFCPGMNWNLHHIIGLSLGCNWLPIKENPPEVWLPFEQEVCLFNRARFSDPAC
jgi:hypothetical protein